MQKLLSRRSIFDEDSKRLENLSQDSAQQQQSVASQEEQDGKTSDGSASDQA